MSDTAIALDQRTARPVDAVRQALERMKPQLAMALPKHLTADRLLRVAMTAVQNTPKLLDCDRTSLYSAVFTCAQLGLEPDGVLGQAYLVPFNGKVQFIPGYRGLISLARNSGEVSSIAAHEVCDNDAFEFDFASGDPPKHTFDIRKPRGGVIAFYAVVKFKDGAFHWDMMTRAEVDAVRDQSQGWKTAVRFNKTKDTPWRAHYVEMGKKTVIRRIVKYLPLSVQKAAALADSYDTGRHVTLDSHGELVIDHTADAQPALEHRVDTAAPQSQLESFEEAHGQAPTGDTYDPETGEILDPAAGTPRVAETRDSDPLWVAEFAALRPRETGQAPDEVDWPSYVDVIVNMIGKASESDLNTVQLSENIHLRRLREENTDLFRTITNAIAARARELAGGATA